MTNELSNEVQEYLARCGLPKAKISQCTESTRLYHDLGVYGDVAAACMELLEKQYQVDLSGFEFDRFFPPEFEGKNVLTRAMLWLLPGAGKAARQQVEYAPVTMAMIEKSIAAKKWSD